MFTSSGAGFGAKSVTEPASAGWRNTTASVVRARSRLHRHARRSTRATNITCTYVNKKDATVTIVKDAQPNAAQDFAYTTPAAAVSGFSLDDDADCDASERAHVHVLGRRFGSKTVTESAVAGWSNTSLVCSEGTVDGSTATLRVDPGR